MNDETQSGAKSHREGFEKGSAMIEGVEAGSPSYGRRSSKVAASRRSLFKPRFLTPKGALPLFKPQKARDLFDEAGAYRAFALSA